MGRPRTWTDEQLKGALPEASSWRSVMRGLGIAPSSGAVAAIIRRIDELGLDRQHLPTTLAPAPRKQSDAMATGGAPDYENAQRAVADATNWTDVLAYFDLPLRSSTLSWAKGWVAEHGLEAEHLVGRAAKSLDAGPLPFGSTSSREHLPKAGTARAAHWFMERGHMVSLPMEPAPYDLVVDSEVGLKKVQVKTTTQRSRSGRWQVGLTQNRFETDKVSGQWKVCRTAYKEGATDFFFILCSNGQTFLIPAEEVLGKQSLVLDVKYANFEVSSPCE